MKTRFLIIRFSSIGDIILTTPVIRGLKQQVEDAEIHFVTKAKYVPLLKANPWIDQIHVLDDKITPLLEILEKEEIDYVIDLHHNIRSGQVKRRLNVPAFSFSKLNFEKWLMVNFKVNRLPHKHIVDRYLETVSVFDIANDGKGLDYFIPEGEGFDIRKLPPNFLSGYIAFVIGGTYATKRLPVDTILEICSKIPFPVVLLGGHHEEETGQRIAESHKGKVINLAGKTTINESASLIQRAELVLTNDTGLMHIAAALGKKILSFWGNTIPEFGMSPYQPDPESKILQVDGLKCRPCSKLGFEKCPKKHFRCMNDIPTDQAVHWIMKNFKTVQAD
ncbi:ADP-heptose:LPS heptosyltransferase [Bacteroidales bacterium 6E]|nr:ADP-heptose:LPS heptosyltransferase [Bacteroidales bacterium 6E]